MPNEIMELGAVGYLEDGRFAQHARLKDFGIAFASRTSHGRGSLEYQSSSGVTTKYKAAGKLSEEFAGWAKASAGVRFEFGRSGATVFSVPSYSITEIDDKRSLERALRSVSEWRRNWVVVTKVVNAKTATILVAGGSDSWAELKAAGKAAPGGIEVADVGVGFSRGRTSGMAVRIVAKGSLTPLYEVSEMKRPRVPINGRQRSKLGRATRKAAKRAPAKKAAKRAPAKKAARRAPARTSARR